MRRRTKWLLVLGVFFLLFVLVGVAAAFSVSRGPSVPRHAVLWLQPRSAVPEEDRRPPLERLFGERVLTVRDYQRVLESAAEDSRIEAVVLAPEMIDSGWASAEEIRGAIESFRERSGKPVYSFLEFGGDLDYFLASAADRVVMTPSGVLLTNGLMADVPFYKGVLDKVGIRADLEHIGDYKSASDIFTRKRMSDAHREAVNTILDGLYGGYVTALAQSRSVDPEEIRAALDEGFVTASRARDLGLVDELLYVDELLDAIEEETGVEPRRLDASSYLARVGEGRGDRIALVYLTGTIVPGKSSTDPFGSAVVGSQTVRDVLKDVREDGSIRGVILRVDSPGGSGLASDVIWREVELTKREKPVVVSMSDVAASGGYYVAMGADAIVAQPGTITGSIGVISGKFSLRGMYDWIELHREQIKRGENADLFSDYREFTQDQRALLRSQMWEFYREFVRKAAEGRGMSSEQVDAVGQGRIWTGAQARERGLVDELGGLPEALRIVKDRAGISEERSVRLEVFPKPKGVLESLFSWSPRDELARGLAELWLPPGARRALAEVWARALLESEPYLYLDETLAGLD